MSDRRPLAFVVAASVLVSATVVPFALAARPVPQDAAARQSGATPPSGSAAHETSKVETHPSTQPRIHEVLAAVHEDVRVFNEHLMVLASPWMDGRLPGTKGMEQAMNYVEWGFRKSGLVAPTKDASGAPSYRQPFPLGDKKSFSAQTLTASVGGSTTEFALNKDWSFTGLGSAGDVTGTLVFVGYGIDSAEREYRTFADDVDLTGKIALLLRFEPMKEDGSSKWSDRGWSQAAGFQQKLANVTKRNPAGIIIVNTPGAQDDRVKSLRISGDNLAKVPVAIIGAEAADSLVRLADGEGRSLAALRTLADEKGVVMPLPKATVHLGAKVESTKVTAENVVGLLPGRGALKDQIIVMGGHLDHLGYGDFGSRSGPGALHPGADDNASGSAGIMLLADLLTREYAKVPADQPLRSILFIAFSAEESGLNGSRYYTQNPLFPARDHVLMFNYDMIGRMKNERLSVSGSGSAKGMHEWATAIYAQAKASYGIEVVATKESDMGGSDHASFLAAGIPALFGIIADFHQDYHTPKDVYGLINRESAVKSVWLFRDLALDAAKRPERFEFDSSTGPMRGAPMRVRLGVRSAETDDGSGVAIAEVTADGAAQKAGFRVGDKLIKWNKQPVKTRDEFVTLLRSHEPGDEVQAVVVRDGQEVTLFVKFPPKS